jgi:hypothetical protein
MIFSTKSQSNNRPQVTIAATDLLLIVAFGGGRLSLDGLHH